MPPVVPCRRPVPRAGSAAGAVTSASSSWESVGQTVTTNRATVERIGVAAIAFVVLWLAIGLDIALLAAALYIGFEMVLRVLSSPPEEDDAAKTGDATES